MNRSTSPRAAQFCSSAAASCQDGRENKAKNDQTQIDLKISTFDALACQLNANSIRVHFHIMQRSPRAGSGVLRVKQGVIGDFRALKA